MTPVSFAAVTDDRSDPRRDSSDSNGSRRPPASYFGVDGVSAAAAVVAAMTPGWGWAWAADASRAFVAAVAALAAVLAASMEPFGSRTAGVPAGVADAAAGPGVAALGGASGGVGLPHALTASATPIDQARGLRQRITSPPQVWRPGRPPEFQASA